MKKRLTSLLLVIAMLSSFFAVNVSASPATALNIKDASLSYSWYKNGAGQVYSLSGSADSAVPFSYSVPDGGVSALIFFRGTGTCGKSNKLFQELAAAEWADDERINLVAVECTCADRATVQEYMDTYDPNGLIDQVYYNPYSNAPVFWYAKLVEMNGDMSQVNSLYGSMGFTYILLVTASGGENYIQYEINGADSAAYVANYLSNLIEISDPTVSDELTLVTVPGKKRYDYVGDILELVNEQRVKYGAGTVTLSAELSELAMQRAAECAIYFDHTRPNREGWSGVEKDLTPYSGELRSENLAVGQASPEEAMTAWMNSTTGHRENILETGHSQIGIGCFENSGILYWVQLFGVGNDQTSLASQSSVPADVSVETFVSRLSLYLSPASAVSVTENGSVRLPLLYSYNKAVSSNLSAVLLPKVSVTPSALASVSSTTGTGAVTLYGKSAGSGTVFLRAYDTQKDAPSVSLSVKGTPASITAQPKSVTTTPGKAVSFSVAATGSGLKYQWQHSTNSGKTWSNNGSTGSTTNTLQLNSSLITLARSGMQFRCVITDVNGNKEYSNAAVMTVKVPAITITSQPKSVTTAPNKAVSFSVAATGNGLKYQWQHSTNGGKTWSNNGSTGSTTNTLQLNSSLVILSRNGMQFRCVITDVNGNKEYSNAAVMTVKA